MGPSSVCLIDLFPARLPSSIHRELVVPSDKSHSSDVPDLQSSSYGAALGHITLSKTTAGFLPSPEDRRVCATSYTVLCTSTYFYDVHHVLPGPRRRKAFQLLPSLKSEVSPFRKFCFGLFLNFEFSGPLDTII